MIRLGGCARFLLEAFASSAQTAMSRIVTAANEFVSIASRSFPLSLSNKWAFAPRFAWYQDRDDFVTGAAQNLMEMTSTVEYKE